MARERRSSVERFPSKDAIRGVFEKLIRGRAYKELRVVADADGVSIYEIEVVSENGERMEYNYQRADYDHTNKSLPATAQFSASIHATFYGADGMPVSGQCVANYRDGTWEYVPISKNRPKVENVRVVDREKRGK